MASRTQYVNVMVVNPNSDVFDAEINPSIGDDDLKNEIISNASLFGLDDSGTTYTIRRPQRDRDGKIREGSIIVIDVARQGALGPVKKRS